MTKLLIVKWNSNLWLVKVPNFLTIEQENTCIRRSIKVPENDKLSWEEVKFDGNYVCLSNLPTPDTN